MPDLARRVGLGLASRGSVDDCVEWAERARASGIESVWFHDSYFERDAVTYASAVASRVEEIGVGLGALNPFTRHPVLIAMTVSALDDMAPGRIRLGLGSALPLRLGQMGIPYAPDEAATRTLSTIDTLRTLWKGERMPPGKPGLPPLQPMFPPVHRVPIYVAGYRSPMMVVAGQEGDGYIARPAESIPGLRKLLRVMDRSAREAGRDPDAIDVAGYLLTLVDETRRDALNRAKREAFVIYMMSILSDVTLKRAGFEPALRDRIAAAWRAEDYTTAGRLIPDDLLDAFILCGTRREVAEQAQRYHVALVGGVCLHSGTNVTNEIYDVRKGVDTIVSPRASHAIVKGRIGEREAQVFSILAFAIAFALGVYLVSVRGWPIVALGLAGLIGGYTYTAPPFQYKFGSFGIPLVFLLMGPLMVVGSYYAITGEFDWRAVAVSLPVGFLVAAILHGNEWRDISEDARAGARTFSVRMGRSAAHWLYVALVVGAYLALSAGVAVGLLPTWTLLAMLSLPLLVRQIRSSELGATGQQRAIAMIDLETAQLHAAFGYLLVAGLVIAALLAR